MNINTSIALSTDNQKKLSTILKCSGKTFADELEKISSAALEEYVMMILGDEIFSSITDIQVYRLSRLILQCFKDFLPNEETVSRLFKITLSSSKSLLHAAASKYQYELENTIRRTICKLLKGVVKTPQPDGTFMLTINTNSRFFIELMNERIAGINVTLPSITRIPRRTSSYEIQQDTYDELSLAYCNKTIKVESSNG